MIDKGMSLDGVINRLREMDETIVRLRRECDVLERENVALKTFASQVGFRLEKLNGTVKDIPTVLDSPVNTETTQTN